jgi:hypothetical protein
VEARAAAARRGGAGAGQRVPGSGAGVAGARHMAGEAARVTGAKQSRGRGWRLKTRADLRFSKNTGTLL